MSDDRPTGEMLAAIHERQDRAETDEAIENAMNVIFLHVGTIYTSHKLITPVETYREDPRGCSCGLCEAVDVLLEHVDLGPPPTQEPSGGDDLGRFG